MNEYLHWRAVCHTDKAEQAQQHPGCITTTNPAEDSCKKQCGPCTGEQCVVQAGVDQRDHAQVSASSVSMYVTV